MTKPHLKINKPVFVNSHLNDTYPLRLNYTFPNIGEQNCEDVVWQNLIDDTSEIPQYEIGVSLTQSYQYTKLEDEPSILVRWQAVKTRQGPEFRIGLGEDKPGSKETPHIIRGNFEEGIVTSTNITISEHITLGCVDGELAMKKVNENKWYKIQIGEAIDVKRRIL